MAKKKATKDNKKAATENIGISAAFLYKEILNRNARGRHVL
jgi:hypothetical protein